MYFAYCIIYRVGQIKHPAVNLESLGNRSQYNYDFLYMIRLGNLTPEGYKFFHLTFIMWPRTPWKMQKVIFIQHRYSYVIPLVRQSWHVSNQPSCSISPVDYRIWGVIQEPVQCTIPGCGWVAGAAAAGWDMDLIPAEHHGWYDRTVT